MWFKYVLIACFVLDMALFTARVGEDIGKRTAEQAVGVIVTNLLLIWGIVVYFGACAS